MAYNPNIALSGRGINALGALAGGNQAAAQVGEFNRTNALNRLLNDQGPQIAAGDSGALAALSRFDPKEAMGIQAHHEAKARAAASARASAARAATNAAQADKLRAEVEQNKRMLGQAAMGMRAGDPRAWNMVVAGLGQPELEPTEDNFQLVTAVLAGSEEGIADAMRGPEPLALNDRYKNVGNQLVDLAADGGPRSVLSGEGDQPAFNVKMADGTVVSYGGDGAKNPVIETDKPKKDYQRTPVFDDAGNQTGFKESIIVGSETWNDLVDSSQKIKRSLDSFSEKNQIVVEDIDRTIDLIENATIPPTGLVNWISGGLPSTTAYEVNSLLETVTGNVAFDYLADMRQNSPTGGGVGQLSDDERKAMSSIQGSIKGSNSKSTLLYNLNRLRDARNGAENRLKSAYQQDFKDVISRSGSPEPGAMTPQDVQSMSIEEARSIDPSALGSMSREAIRALVERLEAGK